MYDKIHYKKKKIMFLNKQNNVLVRNAYDMLSYVWLFEPP